MNVHQFLAEEAKVSCKEGSAQIESQIAFERFEEPLNCPDLNHSIPLESGANEKHFTVKEKSCRDEVGLVNALKLPFENSRSRQFTNHCFSLLTFESNR